MNGGSIEKLRINSFNELSGQRYDVIFNCTGLGARYLCNDEKIVPVRGQVIKVHAPWLKTAFYADSDTYIIPGFDGMATLGGTRQYESWNEKVDRFDSMAIRERCFSLVPSLVDAPTVREAVGLRPHRSTVRVEAETFTNASGKRLNLIHNYGHGGYGVTTSPGTAKYAVEEALKLHVMSGSKL